MGGAGKGGMSGSGNAGGRGGAGSGGMGGASGTGMGGAGNRGGAGMGGAGTGGACAVPTPVPDSLANGGFESPVLMPPTTYVGIPQGFEPNGFAWTVPTGSVDLNRNWVPAPAYEGAQYIDLVGTGTTGAISQSFQVVPGRTYTLTFAYANNPYNGPNPSAAVSVSGCGQLLLSATVSHTTSSASNFDWTSFSRTFVANSSVATLEFTTIPGGELGGILLDAVAVSVVN
jgi:choice-of-anchor C domain-containing protein